MYFLIRTDLYISQTTEYQYLTNQNLTHTNYTEKNGKIQGHRKKGKRQTDGSSVKNLILQQKSYKNIWQFATLLLPLHRQK